MGSRLVRVIDAADFLALNFQTKAATEDGILAKMTAPYRTSLATEAVALGALLSKFTVAP